MSTFDGFVKGWSDFTLPAKYLLKSKITEFPTIRIDHFRTNFERPRPVVGFLSHVHSDHLQGLESWGRIPLYCSPTTRQLLLRLETYPHRMNFANGILESKKQHFKALESIIKPLPLNTPTEIEIALGMFIRVTLLDANHCAGAVMFLIENDQKAILYTGDIRSERWWVDSLVRNPTILVYSLGIKRLDNMYLDTTFATKNERFRSFQSKAAGIKELLDKMLKFPKETVFHFHAWTLGYEEVWIAMSAALKSQIHVDEYKRTLYGSLAPESPSLFSYQEGPALFGFKNGNCVQKGCLTNDRTVRLHSCEHGSGCPVSSSSETVYITPMVCRGDDDEIVPEIGAGGGGGDLLHNHAYLEISDAESLETLLGICNQKIEDTVLRSDIRYMLVQQMGKFRQGISLADLTLARSEGNIKMEDFVDSLIDCGKSYQNNANASWKPHFKNETAGIGKGPRQIRFPYSRHSSYEELCTLVEAFRPRDIYPCTVNWKEWTQVDSVENLFGHLSDLVLAHDQDMVSMETQRAALRVEERPYSPSYSPNVLSSQSEGPDLSYLSAHDCETFFQDRPKLAKHGSVAEPKQEIAKLKHEAGFPSKHARDRVELNIHPLACDAQESRFLESKGHFKDADLQELSLHRSISVNWHNGTQDHPFDLSDNSEPTVDNQAPDIFFLEAISEPEVREIPKLSRETQEESQITRPDACFQSQLIEAHEEDADNGMGGIIKQGRRRAYKALVDVESTWEEEQALVSSVADHGEVEVEL